MDFPPLVYILSVFETLRVLSSIAPTSCPICYQMTTKVPSSSSTPPFHRRNMQPSLRLVSLPIRPPRGAAPSTSPCSTPSTTHHGGISLMQPYTQETSAAMARYQILGSTYCRRWCSRGAARALPLDRRGGDSLPSMRGTSGGRAQCWSRPSRLG